MIDIKLLGVKNLGRPCELNYKQCPYRYKEKDLVKTCKDSKYEEMFCNGDMLEVTYMIDDEIVKVFDTEETFDNRVHQIKLNKDKYDKEHIKRLLDNDTSLFQIVSM